MQALGLIETKGLLAAIEAADTMVKSADVSIVEKTYIGGGLVTISITGDVGAVKAAVESGVAAVNKLDQEFLISNHVIPRPHQELENIIEFNTPEEILKKQEEKNVVLEDNVQEETVEEETVQEQVEDVQEESTEEKVEIVQEEIQQIHNTINENQDALEADLDKLHNTNLENLHKDDIDNLVRKNGIEKTILILTKLRVVKLRNLAREYKDFAITGRAISKAGKKLLIAKFKVYYEKK